MSEQIQTARVTVSVLHVDVPQTAPAFRVEVRTNEGSVFWAPTYGMPLSDPETPENRLAQAALELVDRAYKHMAAAESHAGEPLNLDG